MDEWITLKFTFMACVCFSMTVPMCLSINSVIWIVDMFGIVFGDCVVVRDIEGVVGGVGVTCSRVTCSFVPSGNVTF